MRRSGHAAIEAYRKGGFADLVLEGKHEYVAALRLRRAVLEERAARATTRRWSRS